MKRREILKGLVTLPLVGALAYGAYQRNKYFEQVDQEMLDDIQLGTGVLYTRWAEMRKKTVVDEVLRRGPMVRAVPIEDFFVPGGAYSDLQQERWVAIRQFLTRHEMNLRERDLGWDIEGIQPTGNMDRIRQIRERLGRTNGFASRRSSTDPAGGELFEIYDVYCYFDIDDDGVDEDLLVTFEWHSKKVLKLISVKINKLIYH